MSAPGSPNKWRIALFCGGRGSATIIRALLRRDDVELTLLVNAYDDGLSTGSLRNFIPGMLGPSDFRKNLSYLFGNYSQSQYALKSLMEYRLPGETGALRRFAGTGDPQQLEEPVKGWFVQLVPQTSIRMRALLTRFFSHAAGSDFDYRDCSLGNLVFAGAYLEKDGDFNAAAAAVAELVGTRARLLNVAEQQNRVLLGLKRDGTLLASEAAIVGPQSPSPIAALYLLEQPLTAEDVAGLAALDPAAKESFLAARDSVPLLSKAAAEALAGADIVLYGPGTQHSSLFPSYRIAHAALAASPAPVKALVMNLESDHDIQGLSAGDIAERAIAYGARVTHILLPETGSLPEGALRGESWNGAAIVRRSLATPVRPHVHNGNAVAECVLGLLAKRKSVLSGIRVEIFADILGRSVASEELVEEFLETDWGGVNAHLTLNRVAPQEAPVAVANLPGLFPETAYFRTWLNSGTSDYLVLMTGDGAYRFADVQAILHLLEQQQSLGGVFGSRTQSRRQFITSVRAAYGENRLLYGLGKMAAFFLSMLFYFRTGVIFSDPLTGLRVFRRAALADLPDVPADAPLAIVRQLIRKGVEVAELPVLYRTFSGFTDPNWRVRRGLRNLAALF
ncbi:MAG TPA: 2-phospho-L-lactate transferase CofD family protein [Rhizomicrobium sp.]|nr:2-phospho-L-lactate transferase CofD family protein [Rhizomicrobium sp.]